MDMNMNMDINMDMNIYLLIFGLTSSYVLYYVLVKLLSKTFTLKEILVHAYIISAILMIILFKQDFQNSMKKIDLRYILIIILAIIMISGNAFGIIGCNNKINFGIIDGMATAFYLPIVALIAAIFYKSSIPITSFIGILFVGIGAYLINSAL
jgi:drug/metabolite transporter (DMT)-like permease